MIIKKRFIKVMLLSINSGRLLSAWFVRKYNAGKVIFSSNSHLVTPAGSSMFGLLVSNDAARERWF